MVRKKTANYTTRLLLAGCVLLAWFSLRPASAQQAARIVSTAPSLTETLFALGLGPHVVGVSKYCEWPPEVKSLPRVGSYIQPDVEAIVRLRPDLVLLERASNEVPGRLAAFGIRYAEVPHGTLAQTYDAVQTIAQATGVPDRGRELLAKMQAALAAIQARAAKSPRVRVLMIADRTPGTLGGLIAVGPGNYENEVLAIAGGENVLATAGGMSYPRISLETVLRTDPDVIVDLTDAHAVDAAHISARQADLELWGRERGLQAVRNHRVFMADSTVFVVPGPRVPEAAERLFEALHRPGTAK